MPFVKLTHLASAHKISLFPFEVCLFFFFFIFSADTSYFLLDSYFSSLRKLSGVYMMRS